jgi:aryl-alcohol dehydrogenase-like predicted oxidoreductase
MQTRRLGNSDLLITPLGVGAWAMGGGDWAFGWGNQEDQDSVDAIHAALDAGWNWIDTAAVYGLGHAEEVVGRALKQRSGTKPYVFTKCERVWDAERKIGKCLKRESIKQEVESSLRRLQVDVIDLYQIHWPEPDEDIEEGWQTMVELQREGKVRWIGLSNFSASQMARVAPFGAITSLQPPYSIVSPEIEESILPYCAENQIGVIVYSPMKSGLLTGKMTAERVAQMPDNDFRKRAIHFNEPYLSRNLKLVYEVLSPIASNHDRNVGEVALAWALRRPEVSGAIVGLRSPAQLKQLQAAAEFRLSSDEVSQIQQFMEANVVTVA